MQGCDFDFVLCCSRYDDMVLEAVTGLKEPYGSSTASIATYIEVYNFLFFLVILTNYQLSRFYSFPSREPAFQECKTLISGRVK